MADLSPAIQAWLADHHGVATLHELRARGVGRKTTNRLLERGVLRRVAKSVFIITSAPRTLLQRCAVLSAAHPTGFVTGPTAGTLAGLRRMPSQAPLHFAIRHGINLPVDRGVRYRQTTALQSIDRHVRSDGITVASWLRLAFDLAADLAQLDHVSVVQQLLHERRVTVDQLIAIERRLGHPARPGSGVFLRTLHSLGGPLPNESHPEVELADALRRRDVPIEHQARQRVGAARYRIDLAVLDVLWGVELDIHPEHRSVEGMAKDARKRRDLHLRGWQIETVTEPDMADVESLADHLAALYRARSRQLNHPSVS